MFWKVNNLNPAQGFEHVKRYAGLAAGKPRGCSEMQRTCSEHHWEPKACLRRAWPRDAGEAAANFESFSSAVVPGGFPVASRWPPGIQAGSLHGGGDAEAGAGEAWPQQSVDHWRHQRARPEAKEITDVWLPGHNLRDRVIVDRYIDVLNVLVVATISLILEDIHSNHWSFGPSRKPLFFGILPWCRSSAPRPETCDQWMDWGDFACAWVGTVAWFDVGWVCFLLMHLSFQAVDGIWRKHQARPFWGRLWVCWEGFQKIIDCEGNLAVLPLLIHFLSISNWTSLWFPGQAVAFIAVDKESDRAAGGWPKSPTKAQQTQQPTRSSSSSSSSRRSSWSPGNWERRREQCGKRQCSRCLGRLGRLGGLGGCSPSRGGWRRGHGCAGGSRGSRGSRGNGRGGSGRAGSRGRSYRRRRRISWIWWFWMGIWIIWKSFGSHFGSFWIILDHFGSFGQVGSLSWCTGVQS